MPRGERYRHLVGHPLQLYGIFGSMTNNDVLRRLRYTFDFSDAAMINLFQAAGDEATRSDVSSWLKQDDDGDFQSLDDERLAAFLNGLINEKRGKREGPPRPAQIKLSNNDVLRKLKIALNLQAAGMLEILLSAQMPISKHELSALFRKPTHKHYRECKDQLLRAFLKGIQLKYREEG